MKKQYVQAVLESLQSGKDVADVLKGLSVILQKRGHERLHASVLREVLRVLSSDNEVSGTRVIVARESDARKFKSEIEKELTALQFDPHYEVSVRDNLVGGYIIEHESTIIDASYKKKLLTLYRSLIN